MRSVDVPEIPGLCPRCASALAAGALLLAVAPLPGGGQALAGYCPESSVGFLLVELAGRRPSWYLVGPVAPEAWADQAAGIVTGLRERLVAAPAAAAAASH
jgi:hypothetical protein